MMLRKCSLKVRERESAESQKEEEETKSLTKEGKTSIYMYIKIVSKNWSLHSKADGDHRENYL